MGHQDGVDYLLRALKHLREDIDRDDFYCVIMGNGDARPSLITAAGELGLEDGLVVCLSCGLGRRDRSVVFDSCALVELG